MTQREYKKQIDNLLTSHICSCDETRKIFDKVNDALRDSKNIKAADIFKDAVETVIQTKDPSFLRVWLNKTYEIMGIPWETLWNWLNYSPAMQGVLENNAFMLWAQFCAALSRYNLNTCNWVIKNSCEIFKKVNKQKKLMLINMCLELNMENWLASVEFFKTLPIINRFLSDKEITDWFNEGLFLAKVDTRLGEAYFKAGSLWSSISFSIFADWMNCGKKLSFNDKGLAIAYFDATPSLIQNMGEHNFKRMLKIWPAWIRKIYSIDLDIAICFIKSSCQVIPKIKIDGLVIWADIVLDISNNSKKAAKALVNSSELAFEELNVHEYANWYRHVLEESSNEETRFCENVALQTRESKRFLISFRQGISLEDVTKSLTYYATAFFNKEIIIKPAALLPKQLTEQSVNYATGDGKRIYLPRFLSVYPTVEDNIKLYKSFLIHEIAHILEGTYEITDDEITYIANAFNILKSKNIAGLYDYFKMFDNYDLIKDLFEYIEDARVEMALQKRYPGIEKELDCTGMPDLLDLEGSDLLASSLKTIIDLSVNKLNKIKDNNNYYVRTFSTIINKDASVKDSLILATKWYLYIKNKIGNINLYKPCHYVLHRGKLCPELIAASKEVESEYSWSGLLSNDNYSGTKALSDLNAAKKNQLISHLKDLIKKLLQEESESYKAIEYYDEWDCTLLGYKPDWTRVLEIELRPSSAYFVRDTLSTYYGLVSSLKRYFALLRPDRFRRYRRQEDGDQEDLDAIVETWIDKKRGVASPGGFYIRRDKRVRDVAVAFLVDLSDSTDQRLESGKTILDVEKESVVIMAEALEILGDKYAIYGFNSEGRERVNFYIVKEFNESYNTEVKQRFGGFRSGGQTRLGAAVRHAIRKLEKIEASVRLLILLSDGRPYDEGYRAEFDTNDLKAWIQHDELLYAQEDSRVAISEARMKLITPFCITVDSKGKEYLEKIIGSIGYIVIDNIELLPVKLPELYKKLTV